jgi:hypothetical protein
VNLPVKDNIFWVHYLPIGTTILAALFAINLFRRYAGRREGLHLLWWGIGIAFYGLGTFFESIITLFGNTIFLNKAWYVSGAVLGGYPLAQGSVYLLHPRRFAHIISAITIPLVSLTSLFVIMSPVFPEMLELHRPSGAILGWRWIRWMTPFINVYSAFFLVGGAAVSSWRYFKRHDLGHGALGSTLIAVGAILPGIGGSMAKAGIIEALYIGEFIGIILIWSGDTLCRSKRPAP